MTTPLHELTHAAQSANRFGRDCVTLAKLCETFPPVSHDYMENDLFLVARLYVGDVHSGGFTYYCTVRAYAAGSEDGVTVELQLGHDNADAIDLQGAEQFGRNYAEALDVMRRANQELARLAANQIAAA